MAAGRIVIVADDDDDIRECFAGLLRDEGLDVRVAQHGRAALDLLDALGDDRCVLLLDLMMPVMSGFEVLEVLARSGRLAGLPVIVCSASNEIAPIVAGARHVLRKPLDFEALLSLLEAECFPTTTGIRLRVLEGDTPAPDRVGARSRARVD